jgi:hypothetical protein
LHAEFFWWKFSVNVHLEDQRKRLEDIIKTNFNEIFYMGKMWMELVKYVFYPVMDFCIGSVEALGSAITSATFLLDLHFCPEDGGDKFLRTVC